MLPLHAFYSLLVILQLLQLIETVALMQKWLTITNGTALSFVLYECFWVINKFFFDRHTHDSGEMEMLEGQVFLQPHTSFSAVLKNIRRSFMPFPKTSKTLTLGCIHDGSWETDCSDLNLEYTLQWKCVQQNNQESKVAIIVNSGITVSVNYSVFFPLLIGSSMVL